MLLGQDQTYIQADFEARLNRFMVRCLLGGRSVLAYLANPGRLWEILGPGRKLYLVPSPASRKLPYTVVAADIDGQPVLLHTHWTNFYAEKLLSQQLVPGLEGWTLKKKELPLDSSRFDFLLEGKEGLMALEVKTCTLFARHLAFFPDAVTDRGRRHLLTLDSLAQEPGWQSAVLFVVWWPQARYFLPDFHTDWRFAQAFLETRKRIHFSAIAIGLDHNLQPDPRTLHPLTIPWSLLETEARDSGAYILIIEIDNYSVLRVGKRGDIEFPPGYYLYVGSARRNLNSRLRRHQRQRKRTFWHIDYLLARAKLAQVLAIRTASALECPIALSLSQIAEPIPGFGASDCHCLSHLFFLPSDPRHFLPFVNVLHEFRYRRLEAMLLGIGS